MNYLLETARLGLRPFTADDDAFILELLNTPSWLEFIGDRNIGTLDDARHYLSQGPIQSYRTNGYGSWLVCLKYEQTPIGMCGFYKRGFLASPDAGFAFLPVYEGKGYAYEALAACVGYAYASLGFDEIHAFTLATNARCIRLLEKTGFRYQEIIRPPGETEDLLLFTASKL